MNTHFTTISMSKAGNSSEYTERWIDTKIIFTTYEGDRIQGVITHFDQWFAVARFADGTWARLDPQVEVVTS